MNRRGLFLGLAALGAVTVLSRYIPKLSLNEQIFKIIEEETQAYFKAGNSITMEQVKERIETRLAQGPLSHLDPIENYIVVVPPESEKGIDVWYRPEEGSLYWKLRVEMDDSV